MRLVLFAANVKIARMRERRRWDRTLRSLGHFPMSGGAGLIDAVEADILDHIFGGPDYTRLATVYIGLSSTTPTDAGGNITEPSTGAYGRVTVTNNATNFPAASGGAKANGTAFTFVQATADWLAGVDLTHLLIFDAVSAGNPVAYGALTTPKPVLNGDTASIPIGDLDITLD